jgi:alpha-beta hydrolase superfamily lysophospholipase
MLFHMWWWLIPLMFFLAARGGRRRYYRERGHGGVQVAELQRTVDSQRDYIDQLEARLARVEEGLEFAERLLSERAAPAAH